MLIRDAEPARDAAVCAAIYAPFVTGSAISFEATPPSAEDFATRIERINRTHPWLMAELDGDPVGYAYGSPHRERAAYRWTADVSVYLAQRAWRKGIGRALYEALLGLLERQGFHVVCAGITLPNAASLALHEGLGFAPIGVYRRVGFKLGSWWDVGWWELELKAPTDAAPSEPGQPLKLDQPSI